MRTLWSWLAAALLVDSGASPTLLASRGGHVMRDGHGLEAWLRSTGAAATVAASDSADSSDASALLGIDECAGMLHAAGLGDRGLLIELEVGRVRWMHVPKAFGAWHLHCATAVALFEARVLFSSVGSGLGNVGQASYAAANARLDAHAVSRQAHGTAACSVQWPLVGGVGMGAAAFTTNGERQVTRPSVTRGLWKKRWWIRA